MLSVPWVAPGAAARDASVLRTGARIQMGKWCLAYFREEFADHGRPFGGATFGGCVVTAGTPSRRRGIPSDVLGIHDPVGIPLLGQEPLAFRSEVLIERVPGHQ